MSTEKIACPHCNHYGNNQHERDQVSFRCGSCGSTWPRDEQKTGGGVSMITDEEIKRIAEERGLIPEGDLPTQPVERFVDYPELQEQLTDFARAIYQLGRQRQRESDAAIVGNTDMSGLSDAPDYQIFAANMLVAWHDAILANTGDK